MANPPPPPGTMSTREAADALGYPIRCILTRFIRVGLLPWPDRKTNRFKTEDVLALRNWMLLRHDKSADVKRPQHTTH